MEPLWSPVVATGGNQWQIRSARNPPKQAKSVAAGCHRLREKFHGKEGVDGSSPSEGSAKAPEIERFSFSPTCSESNVRWVWSRLWSFRARDGNPLTLLGGVCKSRRCVITVKFPAVLA